MRRRSPSIPWYLRPTPFFGILIGGNIALFLAAYYAHPLLTPLGMLFMLFYVSLPYLFYELLSYAAKPKSKHRLGRCDSLLATLLGALALTGVLLSFGLTSGDRVSWDDLLGLPILVPWLIIQWRASDLLVEIEGAKPGWKGMRVLATFFAFIYYVLGIGWLFSRLRTLKRTMRI